MNRPHIETLEHDAIDDAYASKLGDMFNVLVNGLVAEGNNPQEVINRFEKGLFIIRVAREHAIDALTKNNPT